MTDSEVTEALRAAQSALARLVVALANKPELHAAYREAKSAERTVDWVRLNIEAKATRQEQRQ